MQRSKSDAAADTAATGPISGLLNSLTQVFATLLSVVQTRFELLTAELQEEIQQAAKLLLWTFVAVFAAGIGLFLAALVVVFAFWETHRILASIIVTAVFFVIAGFSALFVTSKLRNKPRMLDATLSEMTRDRQLLEERIKGRR